MVTVNAARVGYVGAMKTSTKLYLTIVFSTLCILFYQYQLSRGIVDGHLDASNNEVVNVDRSRSFLTSTAVVQGKAADDVKRSNRYVVNVTTSTEFSINRTTKVENKTTITAITNSTKATPTPSPPKASTISTTLRCNRYSIRDTNNTPSPTSMHHDEQPVNNIFMIKYSVFCCYPGRYLKTFVLSNRFHSYLIMTKGMFERFRFVLYAEQAFCFYLIFFFSVYILKCYF